MKTQLNKNRMSSILIVLAILAPHAQASCHFANGDAVKEEQWQAQHIREAAGRLGIFQGQLTSATNIYNAAVAKQSAANAVYSRAMTFQVQTQTLNSGLTRVSNAMAADESGRALIADTIKYLALEQVSDEVKKLNVSDQLRDAVTSVFETYESFKDGYRAGTRESLVAFATALTSDDLSGAKAGFNIAKALVSRISKNSARNQTDLMGAMNSADKEVLDAAPAVTSAQANIDSTNAEITARTSAMNRAASEKGEPVCDDGGFNPARF